MQIRVLGTAASEGWPALFCACETCRRARAAGGKDIRSRASIQINDTHKIDFPPDIFYHQALLGQEMSRLRHLFITHTHGDHFALEDLHHLIAPFAHDNEPVLHAWGNARAAEKLTHARDTSFPGVQMEITAIKPFEPVQADGLTFAPVLAVHMSNEECLNYVVSDGSKSLLYTCDTGFYGDQTWDYLEGLKLDLIISECTNQVKHQSTGHTSFRDVLAMRERLMASGTITDRTRILLTHFSHNGGLLHDEMAEVAAPYGIEVAYDGMTVEM